MSLSRIILFKKSSLAHGRAGGKPPLSGFDASWRQMIQPLDKPAIDPSPGCPLDSIDAGFAPGIPHHGDHVPQLRHGQLGRGTECRRCRAPFAEAPAEDLSASLGVICQRCEAYNEPGVARCTTCGYKLDEAPQPAAAHAPASFLNPAATTET